MSNPETEEKINDLEYQIKKIDGHTLGGNIGNRIYGAIGIALPIFLYYASEKNPLAFIAAPIVAEGIGYLLTGKHHFLSYRLLRIHPKYELEKLKKEINGREE